jgi:hypothetical protein
MTLPESNRAQATVPAGSKVERFVEAQPFSREAALVERRCDDPRACLAPKSDAQDKRSQLAQARTFQPSSCTLKYGTHEQYLLGVPLSTLSSATHVRVTCDSCRTATAEVCGKRDPPFMARVAAVRKFKTVGWHHDAGSNATSARALKDAEASGSGRWYCPACSRRTHL